MSIKDYIDEQNKKSLDLNIDTKDFQNLGYWIRSLKYRFKKFEIYNIHISINISYNERGEE